MTTVLPAMHDLTRRILAVEAARATATDTQVDVAVRVCAKLQVPLSRFTGPAGFLSLLSRALVLARAEVPALRGVQIRPDGTLAGFDEIKPDPNEGKHDAGELEPERVALVSHLLGLLATFIGESLTQQLAHNAWPDALLDEGEPGGVSPRIFLHVGQPGG